MSSVFFFPRSNWNEEGFCRPCPSHLFFCCAVVFRFHSRLLLLPGFVLGGSFCSSQPAALKVVLNLQSKDFLARSTISLLLHQSRLSLARRPACQASRLFIRFDDLFSLHLGSRSLLIESLLSPLVVGCRSPCTCRSRAP